MYTYNIHKELIKNSNRLVYSVYIQDISQRTNEESFSIQCIHTTYISQRTNQESENSLVYSVYIQHTYHKELIKNNKSVSIQCIHTTYLQKTNQAWK